MALTHRTPAYYKELQGLSDDVLIGRIKTLQKAHRELIDNRIEIPAISKERLSDVSEELLKRPLTQTC